MYHARIKTLMFNFFMALLFGLSISCETKKASFSLLPAEDTYMQTSTKFKPNKIDVLWVVDNSGSMATSQSHLADNFKSFIARFQSLNFDFHMSVIGTDAWKSQFSRSCVSDHDPVCSHIKDGASEHSGFFVMDSETPDLSDIFIKNIKLGTMGSGDERAFQSFYNVLIDPWNSSFRRADAFLAVIIISDEDDFSEDGYTDATHVAKYSTDTALHYQDPLHSIQHYVDFLDEFTQSAPGSELRSYSVSTISILDAACAANLDQDGFFRYPGQRYQQLAQATGGIAGSLCDDFGNTLEVVSDSIIKYASVFKLDRMPENHNILVYVDGQLVVEDPINGWSYLATDNAIQFNGPSVPKSNAQISINYDPTSVKL